MTEIVGPDGARYKIIRNPLPDPQDYGHVEPVTAHEALKQVAALQGTLDQVLQWPLPEGTIEAWALPEWLATKARAAVDGAFTTCRHPDQGVPP